MFKIIELQNGAFLRADFIAPSIYRIRLSSSHAFKDSALVRYGVITFEETEFPVSISEENDIATFTTEETMLQVNIETGISSLFDKQNKLLLKESISPKPVLSQGFDVSFELTAEERLYGLGDESRDCIQKRGHRNEMIVRNVSSYAPIPYIMSNRGWGILVNTTCFHKVDVCATDNDILRFYASKGDLDYFLIAGSSMPDILDKYTNLSGKPHLLPKWGYGLTYVCDERGVRARDVLYEAYEFRRHDIPCDVIGLEPDWMEKHYDYSTQKEWSRERFHIPSWLKGQDYGSFHAALKNMDFKLSLWLCCNYDLSEYEEMQASAKKQREKEMGNGGDHEADIFKDPHFIPKYMDNITKTGEPWFEHLKKFVDDGASAFKLDGADQICFYPDRKWKNGMDDDEMHNLYPFVF